MEVQYSHITAFEYEKVNSKECTQPLGVTAVSPHERRAYARRRHLTLLRNLEYLTRTSSFFSAYKH